MKLECSKCGETILSEKEYKKYLKTKPKVKGYLICNDCYEEMKKDE